VVWVLLVLLTLLVILVLLAGFTWRKLKEKPFETTGNALAWGCVLGFVACIIGLQIGVAYWMQLGLLVGLVSMVVGGIAKFLVDDEHERRVEAKARDAKRATKQQQDVEARLPGYSSTPKPPE
jgi:hypothetical protein